MPNYKQALDNQRKRRMGKNMGRRAVPKPQAKAVKMLVKKTVKSMSEKKDRFISYLQPMQVYTPIVGATPSAVPTTLDLTGDMFPQIIDGSDNGQRIGNTIVVKRWMLNLTLKYAYDNVDNFEPVNLQLVIGRMKSSIGFPKNTEFDDAYRLGSGTQSLTNTITDNTSIWNSELFTIKKRVNLQLGSELIFDPSATTVVNLYHACNKSVKNVKIDLTKYIANNVKYPNDQANPSNIGLYLWVVGGYQNGVALQPALPVIQLTGTSNLTYTDI